MFKVLVFAFLLNLSFANVFAADDNVDYSYLNGVSVTQHNAAIDQVGTITMTLSVDPSCSVSIGVRAQIEKVPSMARGQTMEAIVITVFPEVKNCGGSWVSVEKTVSAKTLELVQKALEGISDDRKESLPKILRLPQVFL